MPSEPQSTGPGRKFDLGVVYEVLRYSLRKLEAIGKDMDYLPLFFENELRDHAMREKINRKGAVNNVRHLSPVPM